MMRTEEAVSVDQTLYVHLLGGFSLYYGDNPVSFKRGVTTKSMQLLQILLYSGEKGISRDILLEMLYGRDELMNPANNLRVAVHRLRNQLGESILPDGEYISTENGIYRWNAPVDTWVDTHEFDRLLGLAESAEDVDEKINYMEQACEMYQGSFLPMLGGEEWATVESVQYQKKYSDTMNRLEGYLKERGDYEKLLELSTTAAKMYPFEEWQAVKIECYMALNRFEEALHEYEATSSLFFEELGISPTKRLIDQFENMGKYMSDGTQILYMVSDGLDEEDGTEGAFMCTFPSFRDNYRLVRRLTERSGESAYLMVLGITDGHGMPMNKGEKLSAMTEHLSETLRTSLRRGDSYTRYGPSQFLVLLLNVNQESCVKIFRRLVNRFSEQHVSWKHLLEGYANQVGNIKDPQTALRMGGDRREEKRK